jgi:hypothetical protein
MSRHQVPLPIVVVEVAPADADRELVQVLVDSCNSAVPRGRCVLAHSDDGEEEAPAGVAIVSWQDDDNVRVEVGVHKRTRGEWLSQELSFRDQDEPKERWRATGLAIGTLVGEMHWQKPQSKADPSSNPTPDARLPVPSPEGASVRPVARASASWRAWLDAGPIAGPGLDQGSWRVGAFAHAGLQPASFPIFGALSASHRVLPRDPRDVGVTWTSLGVGAGYSPSGAESSLGLDLRIEGVWQYVRVSARDPATGASGSAASSLFGVSAGVDATWTFARPLALLLGGEMSAVNTPLDVRLRDERIGTSPRIQYALFGGARFWLR